MTYYSAKHLNMANTCVPHCTVPFYSLCSVSHVTVSNLFGAHVPKKLLLPKQYIRMMKAEVPIACIISVQVSLINFTKKRE